MNHRRRAPVHTDTVNVPMFLRRGLGILISQFDSMREQFGDTDNKNKLEIHFTDDYDSSTKRSARGTIEISSILKDATDSVAKAVTSAIAKLEATYSLEEPHFSLRYSKDWN